MKLRPFELALIVIFAVLMVLALILLRTHSPEPDENVVTLGGNVNVWGTVPEDGFYKIIDLVAQSNVNYRSVFYTYVPEKDFTSRFISALADGNGPDLLFLNQEFLAEHRSRLEPIPYTSLPISKFRSDYVDGAEVFALEDGIYGYPVAVDPLMLYWNRDLFSSVNRLTAPATWEEVVGDVVPNLTILDPSHNLTQSAIALGEYDNISNAFPIISMLLLQGGSSLVEEKNGIYKVALDNNRSDITARPLSEVMSFYMNFNNISNTLYSWNKNLAGDRELFLNEKLALYFGFGSEAKQIEDRNPNLNFDIAPVPQGATVSPSAKRTYAQFYAFMIPKASLNKTGAYTVMLELGNQANAQAIADSYGFAPVSRSSLAVGSNDIYNRQIYASVPLARSWLNPQIDKSDEVFKTLLNDIAANRTDIRTATSDAMRRLEQAY